MPIYTYQDKMGKTVEKIFPIGTAPKEINVDGQIACRIPSRVQIRTRNDRTPARTQQKRLAELADKGIVPSHPLIDAEAKQRKWEKEDKEDRERRELIRDVLTSSGY